MGTRQTSPAAISAARVVLALMLAAGFSPLATADQGDVPLLGAYSEAGDLDSVPPGSTPLMLSANLTCTEQSPVPVGVSLQGAILVAQVTGADGGTKYFKQPGGLLKSRVVLRVVPNNANDLPPAPALLRVVQTDDGKITFFVEPQ
jgi:hypothetical protein